MAENYHNKVTITSGDNLYIVNVFTGWELSNQATFLDEQDAREWATMKADNLGKNLLNELPERISS